MKLRILIIYMFLFYSYRRCRVSFLVSFGILVWYLFSRCNLGLKVLCHAISFRVCCEVGQNVSLFYSYNDLFHEK